MMNTNAPPTTTLLQPVNTNLSNESVEMTEQQGTFAPGVDANDMDGEPTRATDSIEAQNGSLKSTNPTTITDPSRPTSGTLGERVCCHVLFRFLRLHVCCFLCLSQTPRPRHYQQVLALITQ